MSQSGFDRIPVLSRRDFLAEFKENYSSGQHVTFLGPTQRGKTRLCIEMLKQVVSPSRKCVFLAAKPPGRDGTVQAAAQFLNLRVIETWPPSYPQLMDRRKNGYVLQPVQTMKNIAQDDKNLHDQFQKAMLACYGSKVPVILVADEAPFIQNNLGLKAEFEAPLMRGAPIDGEWSLIQRGRFMSYLVYDAPDHLLIAWDPDVSNRKRYSEIGGIDPRRVEYVAENLKTYRIKTGQTISEFLYIRRAGPEMLIVDVK